MSASGVVNYRTTGVGEWESIHLPRTGKVNKHKRRRMNQQEIVQEDEEQEGGGVEDSFNVLCFCLHCCFLFRLPNKDRK